MRHFGIADADMLIRKLTMSQEPIGVGRVKKYFQADSCADTI
jgi:hypothetical protein